MKKMAYKIRALISILLIISLLTSLQLTTFSAENRVAYIITYHVGAYDVFTDTEGNMSVTIDGVKYYYSDDYGSYDDISDNFQSMKNNNVLYELQNDEIIRVYSLDNVLVPNIKAEPSVREGIFYQNGKFSKNSFDLSIKVSNNLSKAFQERNLLNYLNNTEKERLYTTLKKLEIEPSGEVDFGSSGWWLWENYKTNISEEYDDDIRVNETKEYQFTVNLQNNKALNQSEYNIELYTKPTFDFGALNRITSKVKVGNLDYQEEKTETKKAKSNAGKTASEAATKLEGLKTAIQFSNNILTSEQQKEVNEEVNLWISQLILARNVDKSDLSGKISQDIAKKWLSKLGVDSGVLLSPGVIKATHYLKTKTSGGTEIFIEFNINITSFTFGNSGLPTMASGSGSATIYDMNGQKLDSSTILPAYADVCAFCKQLQAVAKSSILDITKQYRSIFGVDSDATAEALSSEIMGKILNSKYTKNVFKRISARDVKAVLKKIISDGDKKCTDKIFELLTTPSKNSTLVSVKCPVDVTVYDNDGKICGMVKNNVVDTSYNDVFINVVGDQKNIYLIGDDYTFTMTGTDSGKMDYVVKEFDEQGNTTGTITYENIRLTNDCKYYSYVPEAINHDSVLFNLTDNNGNVISATTGIDFEENVNYSGSCGDNAYWRLSDDGVLTIYGSGEMYNYNEYNVSPWYKYRKRIIKVYIADGIKHIGVCAFYKCLALRYIKISDGVKSIGDNAFWRCTSLTSVTIPDQITIIEDRIFMECTGLKSITLPNSITSIGNGAFWDCRYLKNITIPNSVINIDDIAFEYCSNLQSITIPYSVKSIGYSAFRYCYGLTSITISNSVTNIGGSAFEYCESLESITIPDSVTSIGAGAFNGCKILTSITVDKNNSTYSSVDGVLFNKSKDTLIACPNVKADNYQIPNSVTSIGADAFARCTSLKSITIPNSVINIGNYAFYYCTSLTSIIIPDSVTSIGGSAFKGCDNLTIYGYKNTAAEKYAQDNGFEFISLADDMIFSDKSTGITVSGVMQDDAFLNVAKLKNTFENSVATYDITLQKDGAVIQPDGAITIKIPSDVKDCKVMWLKDDGTAEDMNAEYIDGCYVFTTNHLSVYALVQNKQYLKGDANQDGVVNVKDVTYLQMHLVDQLNNDGSAYIDETNRELFNCVDMNSDGNLTILDVTEIQLYIAMDI